MNIAVAGSHELVTTFRFAGIKMFFETKNVEELKVIIPSIMQNKDIGVLILRDNEVSQLPLKLRQKLWSSANPVVISIGSEPEMDIRERIKQAIGVDLYESK